MTTLLIFSQNQYNIGGIGFKPYLYKIVFKKQISVKYHKNNLYPKSPIPVHPAFNAGLVVRAFHIIRPLDSFSPLMKFLSLPSFLLPPTVGLGLIGGGNIR